jgi:hypothetical protein
MEALERSKARDGVADGRAASRYVCGMCLTCQLKLPYWVIACLVTLLASFLPVTEELLVC